MEFENLSSTDVMDWSAVNGTCLQGYVDASYEDLKACFGQHCQGDKHRTDAEWVLKFDNGTVATIYNYKDGKAYLGEDGLAVKDIRDWHVGGRSSYAIDLVNYVLEAFYARTLAA